MMQKTRDISLLELGIGLLLLAMAAAVSRPSPAF